MTRMRKLRHNATGSRGIRGIPHGVGALMIAAACLPAAGQVAGIEVATVPGRKVPFQSHNQKVVRNAHGIFATRGDRDNPHFWLNRSTDGGRTFTTVYEENYGVSPPTLETDEADNLYLIFPTNDSTRTRFMKFAPGNYSSPVADKTTTASSSGGKFASCYDRSRGLLYHATQRGYFLVFDKSGNLTKSKSVWTSGGTAGPSYPHLFVDEGGTIHYAMTTADSDSMPYQTIRYVKSTDGGNNWKAMNGTGLSIPTSCASNGPSTMINLADEVDLNTWLGHMHVKNGKVHFQYNTRGVSPLRQHYMRFNAATGVREIDSYTDWGNQWGNPPIQSEEGDGLFASDPDDPDGPLFAVGRYAESAYRKRLVGLVSHDNGSTWQNCAITPASGAGDISDGKLENIGGCRALTPDGKVIGTLAADRPQWATCYFYQFQAVDNPPTISDVTDRSVPKNTGTGAIPFTVGDDVIPAASLTLTKGSSDTTLVPLSNIVFGGSGADRTVTITPATDRTGVAVITLEVNDGTSTTSDTFLLAVASDHVAVTKTFGYAEAKVALSTTSTIYDGVTNAQNAGLPGGTPLMVPAGRDNGIIMRSWLKFDPDFAGRGQVNGAVLRLYKRGTNNSNDNNGTAILHRRDTAFLPQTFAELAAHKTLLANPIPGSAESGGGDQCDTDVTATVLAWQQGLLPNHGFVILGNDETVENSLKAFGLNWPGTTAQLVVSFDAESFADWIGRHDLGGPTGFADDPDGDHLANGLENFLGADPGAWNAGLAEVASDGAAITFTHPQNAHPAADVTAAYEWSTDLAGWHLPGSVGGTTVTITPSENTPTTGTTTVTVTAEGAVPAALFVRLKASQAAGSS